MSLLTLLKARAAGAPAPTPPSIVVWPDSLPEPHYTLQVGGSDVSLDVDADTLVFGSGMRGFGSLECDLVLEDCNEVACNELAIGANLVLYDNGVVVWRGKVVDLPWPAPEDPVQRVVGAGRWEWCRRDEAYGYFSSSDSTYEEWRELPVRILGDPSLMRAKVQNVNFDTDRQVLLTIPNGTVYKANQGFVVGWWLFDGQLPSQTIRRITADVSCDPGSWIFELFLAKDLYGGPQAPLVYLASYSGSAYNSKIDSDLSAYNGRALILYAAATADGTASADRYFQLRNLNINGSPTGARRRIDQAIDDVLWNHTGIAEIASAEAIGDPLTNLVIAPNTTVAGAIEQIEARHSLPVLTGIWDDDEAIIKVQPTTPPDRTRHYVVSARQDPIAWNVQADLEAVVAIAKVAYQAKPENECAQPTPTSTTWPSEWARSTTTNVESYLSGSDYYFRLKSDATEPNPWATYRPPSGSGDGIAVEAGRVYLCRFRCYRGAYVSGNVKMDIRWYTSGGVYISASSCLNRSTDPNEHWQEKAHKAPATAAFARLHFYFDGASAGATQSLYFRDVEFAPFVDSATTLYEYVPAAPVAHTTRCVEIDAGYQTQAGARAVGQQYLEHFSAQASGTVEVPDFIRDVDGRIWPLSHIRAWDWIECPDYIDPAARGPFMITSCEVSDGLARLGIGGVETYAYDPPEKAQAKRRRFIGAKYVWRKVRIKVKGKWRWVRRKYLRKARYAGEKVRYERVAGAKDRKP